MFRILLTGIHLMRTGAVEANLLHLNAEAGLAYIPELIERKLAGPEQAALADSDLALYEREYERLLAALEQSGRASQLPEEAAARPALHDLLIRLRLKEVQ